MDQCLMVVFEDGLKMALEDSKVVLEDGLKVAFEVINVQGFSLSCCFLSLLISHILYWQSTSYSFSTLKQG